MRFPCVLTKLIYHIPARELSNLLNNAQFSSRLVNRRYMLRVAQMLANVSIHSNIYSNGLRIMIGYLSNYYSLCNKFFSHITPIQYYDLQLYYAIQDSYTIVYNIRSFKLCMIWPVTKIKPIRVSLPLENSMIVLFVCVI